MDTSGAGAMPATSHNGRRQISFSREMTVAVEPHSLNEMQSGSPNRIRTTRFTWLTWLPKSLFAQFHRAANVYFLFVSIIVCLPDGPMMWSSTVVPFIGVLLWTAFKDLYEDMRRKKDDDAENLRTCLRYDPKSKKFEEVRWRDVCIGDILLNFADEAFPADVLLVRTAGGQAFISTVNLDGETNLKERNSANLLSALCDMPEAGPDVPRGEGAHEQVLATVAFAHFYARHLNLPSSQPEAILLPGIDWCRQRGQQAASATLVLVPERQVVQLRASGVLEAGDEIFVETGVHDNTTTKVLRGESIASTAPNAGEVLTVPFNGDETSTQKRLLFQQLNWPMEIRLADDGVQDLKCLRLASMPKEEFTSWSVGALIAGAPLAVSRAFRTEVQATAYLLVECSERGATTRSHPQAKPVGLEIQAEIASRYRKTLTEIYEKCQLRSRQKLDKLLVWAMKQHAWIFNYVQEAIIEAEKRILESKALQVKAAHTMLTASDNLMKLPILEDLNQRQMTDMIAAIVNTKVADFVPYFQQLLQVTELEHLKRLQRLALAMARLKGANCADLSDFAWINHLQGRKEVFTTFKYLLPEMEKLAQEFNPVNPQTLQ